MDKVNVVQKRAIRIINNVGFIAHTNMLFYNCNILKISDLHLCNIGIFIYELSKDNLPDAFVPFFFQRNNTIHSYPTRLELAPFLLTKLLFLLDPNSGTA